MQIKRLLLCISFISIFNSLSYSSCGSHGEEEARRKLLEGASVLRSSKNNGTSSASVNPTNSDSLDRKHICEREKVPLTLLPATSAVPQSSSAAGDPHSTSPKNPSDDDSDIDLYEPDSQGGPGADSPEALRKAKAYIDAMKKDQKRNAKRRRMIRDLQKAREKFVAAGGDDSEEGKKIRDMLAVQMDKMIFDLNTPGEYYKFLGARQAIIEQANEEAIPLEQRKKNSQNAGELRKVFTKAQELTENEQIEEIKKRARINRATQEETGLKPPDVNFLKDQLALKAELDAHYQLEMRGAIPWHRKITTAVGDGFYGGLANGVGQASAHYVMRAIDWCWNGVYYKVRANREYRDAIIAQTMREERMLNQRKYLNQNSSDLESTAKATRTVQELFRKRMQQLEKEETNVKTLLASIQKLEKEHTLRSALQKSLEEKLSDLEALEKERGSIADLNNRAQTEKSKLSQLLSQEATLQAELAKLRTSLQNGETDQAKVQTQNAIGTKSEQLAAALKERTLIEELAAQAASSAQKVGQLTKREQQLHNELVPLDAKIKAASKIIDTQVEQLDEDLTNAVIMNNLKKMMEQIQEVQSNIKEIKNRLNSETDSKKRQQLLAQLNGFEKAKKFLQIQVEVCMKINEPEKGLHTLKDGDNVKIFSMFLAQNKQMIALETAQAQEQIKDQYDKVAKRLNHHNDQHLKFAAIDEAELEQDIMSLTKEPENV
jgi:DNA repair exonuclease SbcCD ATPase subunit